MRMVAIRNITTLVLGASGQTGSRLVEQLLEKNQTVKVIVRSKGRFLANISIDESISNKNLMISENAVLDMSDQDFLEQVQGCDAIVSCLGHTSNMKGMFGKPHKLCTDAIKRTVKAIEALSDNNANVIKKPKKIILMSSIAVANPNGLDDVRPMGERIALSIIRALLPPQKDNEEAAAFLHDKIKSDNKLVQWIAVRPDELLEGETSEYTLYNKPQKGLFGGGTTTRANVAHFMCNLIIDQETWDKWSGKMPVIMNASEKYI